MVSIISDNHSLEELLNHPLTASVFAYLRKSKIPVGVREIQRALNLSNPSTAFWHLNKLHSNGILEHLQGNKYQIREEFSKIRKIPMSVVLDYYFLGSKAVPTIFLLIVFLILTSSVTTIMIIFNLWPEAAFTGLFSLITVTGLSIHSYLGLIKPLEKE